MSKHYNEAAIMAALNERLHETPAGHRFEIKMKYNGDRLFITPIYENNADNNRHGSKLNFADAKLVLVHGATEYRVTSRMGGTPQDVAHQLATYEQLCIEQRQQVMALGKFWRQHRHKHTEADWKKYCTWHKLLFGYTPHAWDDFNGYGQDYNYAR